jgi:hypothetical protein
MHLACRSFKQSPASARKKGVATKQHRGHLIRVQEVSDMTGSVSRDIQDGDAGAKDFDVFAFGDTPVIEVQRFVGWTKDLNLRVLGDEPVHTTHMIAVVVRDQDAREVKLMLDQCAQDWVSLSWVNNPSFALGV